MIIYVSHSPADIKWYRLFKETCNEKGITVITRSNPFEYDTALTEKGKSRINSSTVMVFLLTQSGRSSYRVHQELGYAQTIFKDHFIIGGSERNVGVTKKFFEQPGPSFQNENDRLLQNALETILNDLIHSMKYEAFNFIYHTDERGTSSFSI